MTTQLQPTHNLRDSIEQRRAARSFRPDPIPEDVLQEIWRLGVRSPSGFNLQPWRFVVVREQANKEKLRACAFDQRQITEAPVVLICCGDRRVNQTDYIESVIKLGKDAGGINDAFAEIMRSSIPTLFKNPPCFESMEVWTNRHTMLAVAHLMIVAKSFGVDSCPMEGFVSTQVKEAFNIPAEVDVCCLLPMGYAGEPFKLYGGRFGIEQVFYNESFG
ncbi:MAG: nitroreductase family protein [Symploca sp. SIO3C6]|uniref:Nitroreductase family protein n=1 Tax=Symploca sp. SIO1C4 TaxID=2607765 RepID=A0A6B3NQ64_9CYAN|nr:nitroreductase family protein [Symploca sp. SIO3C6]NER31378.1 nitroreductase family protein [Symploca sp. SIO1C4]NET05844.1 nitroreductase family protein [Symploca sp. SIO2B6]